jgi:hypothetical protein
VAGIILGTGTQALLGYDLTDPENDGTRDGANYNADFDSSHESNYFNNEGAFNVFTNTVGSGNNKWCCDPAPVWVSAGNFGSSPILLTHFTITSGNDAPGRDADIWSIEGSNDKQMWTPIFVYSNDGTSPWTARNQVLKFSSPEHFQVCTPYRYFATMQIQPWVHRFIN